MSTILAIDQGTSKAIVVDDADRTMDRRAEQICAGSGAERDRVAHRVGLALDPYVSAPKMTWLRRNVTKDQVVTTVDSWLLHQLTGAFVTDAATVSRALAALRTSLTTGDPA